MKTCMECVSLQKRNVVSWGNGKKKSRGVNNEKVLKKMEKSVKAREKENN